MQPKPSVGMHCVGASECPWGCARPDSDMEGPGCAGCDGRRGARGCGGPWERPHTCAGEDAPRLESPGRKPPHFNEKPPGRRLHLAQDQCAPFQS